MVQRIHMNMKIKIRILNNKTATPTNAAMFGAHALSSTNGIS